MRLIHGECLEEMDRLIKEGVKVDAIICDPPYGQIACKWDLAIPFDEMWKRLNKLIKPNGAIVLFGTEPFSSALRMSNVKRYKHEWVWNKVNSANIFVAKYHPLKNTEDIMVFSSGGRVNYYPIMTVADIDITKSKQTKQNSNLFTKIKGGSFYATEKNKKGTERYPKHLITFSNANHKNKVHPTQKPVPLLEYLIKTYTQENELVLDFTMGSGSTGVACKNTNRKFIGIELDENYFNIAKERLQINDDAT